MFFITGTDTGVGKTHFTCQLIRRFRQAGIPAVGFKPICCGDRDDAEKIVAASENALSINECNPLWLRFPASPYTASIVEEKQIDLRPIREQFTKLTQKFPVVLVEGVGGWHVPILSDYWSSHLAQELGLPVLLVAANRLGMLNHTLLTIEAIRKSGLRCPGVIVNSGVFPEDTVTMTNRSVLEEILRLQSIPVLGEMEPADTELKATIFGKIRDFRR